MAIILKRIIVPICNRTNYSKLKPILEKLSADIHIVVSSSMVLERYGAPYKDILNDGFNILSQIDCLLSNDTPESMVKTSALSLIEHSSIYAKHQPNIILAVGDRFDMIPAVLSAKMMNIPVLHIQGGELSGSIDNVARDIISLCSDVHYASTKKAAIRIKSMTNSKSIFWTGCPSVENIKSMDTGDYFDVTSLHKKYKNHIPIKPHEEYFLICVHPDTTKPNDIDMDLVLEVALSFNKKCIVLYPNNDAFSSHIVDGIKRKHDNCIPIKHAPLSDFIRMMAHCSCMIGNSSAGIREAASFGVPVVNIGTRQLNREKNKNTIEVECVREDIEKAITVSLSSHYSTRNLYYKKGSADFIVKHIENYE